MAIGTYRRLCRPKWQVISRSWYAKLGTLHTETNYLLANFLFVRGAESDGETSPSCATVNESIDASSSSLEASIPTQQMRGDANRSSFTTANKYLFADLLLFTSGEGDEATSPSCATVNESIDASSSSLEASIPTQQMRGGCE